LKTLSLFKCVLLIMAGMVAIMITVPVTTPQPVQAQSLSPQAPPPPGSPCRAYDPQKEDPPFCAPDLRINPWDAIATIAGYCQADHSLRIFAIDNSVGSYIYTVSATQIANGLVTAQSTGRAMLLADQSARQVWALPSGELQLHDTASSYDFIFAGTTCSVVAGTVQQPSTTTTVPGLSAGANGTSVTTASLNIRSIPSISGKRLGIIPPRAVIQVIGRRAGSTWDWVKISYNGVTGWVYTFYTELTNDELSKLPVLAK
jgi:hypothetical protein